MISVGRGASRVHHPPGSPLQPLSRPRVSHHLESHLATLLATGRINRIDHRRLGRHRTTLPKKGAVDDLVLEALDLVDGDDLHRAFVALEPQLGLLPRAQTELVTAPLLAQPRHQAPWGKVALVARLLE